MRKLLIPLLAAFALPTAVNAESHWLIINYIHLKTAASMEKIQMNSAEECQREVEKWTSSSTHLMNENTRQFHCIKGK